MNKININIDAKYFTDKDSGLQRLILRDVKLQLSKGEFVAIVGPSGCGKTSLLQIVAGLDQNYQGEILWPPTEHSVSQKLGYVFQNPRLLPWLRVRSNIELVMEEPSSRVDLVDSLLHSTGLQEFHHFYPSQLSLGMQRRAALARAFAVEPYLLLMDEPFVSLDEPSANQLRQLLVSIWSSCCCSVLFVTHDLREAIVLADRIVFLSTSPASVICETSVAIPRHERGCNNLVEARFGELKQLFGELYPDQ